MSHKIYISSFINKFFNEHLSIEKGLSENTILSYRDSLKLLFCYASDNLKTPIDKLRVDEDLNEKLILAFLNNLEESRGCSARTRNLRLSAIRSFFRFIAREEPLLIEMSGRVRAIPKKKEAHRQIDYLDKEQMKAMFSSISLESKSGARDKALLLLMYNTGARVQEIVDLKVKDLRLDSCGQVKLLGKGKKQRACPLWKDTIKTLQDYLEKRGSALDENECLFLNAQGRQLTRFGVRYILKQYKVKAALICPSIKNKSCAPHVIRHSTAMHLIQSGNDINMVSMWLGHADIQTTHVYIEIDMAMKRKMLEVAQPPSSLGKSKHTQVWQESQTLAWLDSLGA